MTAQLARETETGENGPRAGRRRTNANRARQTAPKPTAPSSGRGRYEL